MKRRGIALIPISTIGAVSCGVIAGELFRDLTRGTTHFIGPRWLKCVLLGAILLLEAEESEKVLRHIDRELIHGSSPLD